MNVAALMTVTAKDSPKTTGPKFAPLIAKSSIVLVLFVAMTITTDSIKIKIIRKIQNHVDSIFSSPFNLIFQILGIIIHIIANFVNVMSNDINKNKCVLSYFY